MTDRPLNDRKIRPGGSGRSRAQPSAGQPPSEPAASEPAAGRPAAPGQPASGLAASGLAGAAGPGTDAATWAPRARPTLRTIAAMTGLAVTTVSRALAGDVRIALATRQRVAEAAARVGYVPDRAAQRLRTGRTKVVSALINLDHEFLGFTQSVLSGLSRALAGTGYSVTIFPDAVTAEPADRLAAVRHILRNRMADGLIFTRTEVFDERVRFLMEHDFPFVSHGRTEFTAPHAFVDYDNEAFARAAVARLVALGRRRLLVVLPQPRYTFAQHLRFGFLSAARAAGVAHEIAGGIDLDTPAQAIAAWLAARLGRAEPPDGILCVGEVAAIATLAALADTGRAAGREVDVVAKRASPVFDLLRPRIDTAFEDLQATGRLMGELLLRRIAGEPPERLQVVQAPAGPAGGGGGRHDRGDDCPGGDGDAAAPGRGGSAPDALFDAVPAGR